jgi:hypothetical protein
LTRIEHASEGSDAYVAGGRVPVGAASPMGDGSAPHVWPRKISG